MDRIEAGRTLTRQIDRLALDWDRAKPDTVELTQLYVDTADRMPTPIKFRDLDSLFAQWCNALEFHDVATNAWHVHPDRGSVRTESELVATLTDYTSDLNDILTQHGYVGGLINTDDITGPLS